MNEMPVVRPDISKLPMPKAIADLRRDWRGLPIPFTVEIPKNFEQDGIVDFRITNSVTRRRCIDERLCGICGKSVPVAGAYFIGGPVSKQNHLFFDPGMHRACAEFAMKVCPYLYYKKWKGSPVPDGIVLDTNSIPGRPSQMFLLRTSQWRPMLIKNAEGQKELYAVTAAMTVITEF